MVPATSNPAVCLDKVNQDPAGLPPRLVYQTPAFGSREATTPNITTQVFARPLSGNRLAVVLLNRAAEADTLSVTWAQLGLTAGAPYSVYDVIRNKAAGSATGSFSAVVPSHDVSFVILG